MREIKFRAWDKRANKMYQVNDLGVGNHSHLRTATNYSEQPDTGYNKFYPSEVEVMQYTGLKDKNGVEIYEGDILKIPEWLWEDEQEYCVCIYQQENEVCDVYGFGLYIKDGYSGKYKVRVPSDEWDEFEVVGNIYDNPELIEKEGK